MPWGITFSDPFAASNVGTPLHVALHPTQMYDGGAELLILVFLLLTEKWWRRRSGLTFWVYILLYAVSRFVVEMFRGDPRGMTMGFSTSQFISLAAGPAGARDAVRALAVGQRGRGARAAPTRAPRRPRKTAGR